MAQSSNPFAAPKTRVDIAVPEKPGSPIKGVIYGVLTDFFGSVGFGAVIGFFYAIGLRASGVPANEMRGDLQGMVTTTWFVWVGLTGGCLMSLLAGYVCARTAKRWEYQLAFGMELLVIACSLALGSTPGTWFKWFGIVSSIIAAVCGAHLGRLRNRRAV